MVISIPLVTGRTAKINKMDEGDKILMTVMARMKLQD